jgi:hypothetical protein
VVVPVGLGQDAKVKVTILANNAPYKYELTKNGDYLQAIENKVS